jgi:hypothetical protein
MAGHECYHCKQWVEAGEAHDCWTTTEAALTGELSEDLHEAWERLRETAADFGDQRIYASHHCIMFARTACYFFVRPKKSALEVVFFLGRSIRAPQIRRIERPSQKKFAHIVRVTHRDEVEAPLTDWLLEAFTVSDELSGRRGAQSAKTNNERQKTKSEKRKSGGAARKGATRKARGPKPRAKKAKTTKRPRSTQESPTRQAAKKAAAAPRRHPREG